MIKKKKNFSPTIKVFLSDPPKYRYVHKRLKKILKDYSSKVLPKSIDEFLFAIPLGVEPKIIANEIKSRIRNEVGEYISVSVGIGPNIYLAKIASNLQKPDGLVEINKNNHINVFSKMKLIDLTGIKYANSRRLKMVGINTVLDFYHAPIWRLKLAFGGITGLYWYMRLRGYEIDDFKSTRKTYGNSYAPPPNKANLKLEILSKLCQKTGFRLRKAHLAAGGIHVSLLFRNGLFWHKGIKTKRIIFEDSDIYKEAVILLDRCSIDSLPRIIDVSVFNLVSLKRLQLSLLEDTEKKYRLAHCMDSINGRWGNYTIHYGRMATDPTAVQDRISFGQL